MVVEGKEVKAVRELPWYAGGLAYRLGCDRRFIRKQPHLVREEASQLNLTVRTCDLSLFGGTAVRYCTVPFCDLAYGTLL